MDVRILFTRFGGSVARTLGRLRGQRTFARLFHRLPHAERVIEEVFLGPLRFKLELCPDDHIDYHLHYFGRYEKNEGRLFARLIQPGSTVVDLGANIGYYTVAAALLAGPTGSVHAFEPIGSTYRRLLSNIRLNSLTNVVASNMAVADRCGERVMHLLPGDPGRSSFGTHDDGSGSSIVGTTTLDEYVRVNGIRRIDLIKVDIEGAEALALMGMEQVLKDHAPALLIEINPVRLRAVGSSPEEVIRVLHEQGYAIQRVGHTLTPLPDGPISDPGCNVYAYRQQRHRAPH